MNQFRRRSLLIGCVAVSIAGAPVGAAQEILILALNSAANVDDVPDPQLLPD